MTPKLKNSHGERHDIVTCEEISATTEPLKSLPYHDAKNYFSRQKRNVIYSSPLWRRDSTNRLQRKPSQASINFQIDYSDLQEHEVCANFGSTDLNTLHLQVEPESLTQKRKDLNPKIFHSTMINGYSEYEKDANQNALFGRDTGITRENEEIQSRKLKIFSTLIEWSPFWSRDDDSKRLNRRHYISDFL